MSNCACECTCTSIYIREDKREENGDCANGGEEADVNFNNKSSNGLRQPPINKSETSNILLPNGYNN